MDSLSIAAEALDLVSAGASLADINEMESALALCIGGMTFRNGYWEIVPAVRRVLGNTPPDQALPRFQRGVEVCEAARLLMK